MLVSLNTYLSTELTHCTLHRWNKDGTQAAVVTAASCNGRIGRRVQSGGDWCQKCYKARWNVRLKFDGTAPLSTRTGRYAFIHTAGVFSPQTALGVGATPDTVAADMFPSDGGW